METMVGLISNFIQLFRWGVTQNTLWVKMWKKALFWPWSICCRSTKVLEGKLGLKECRVRLRLILLRWNQMRLCTCLKIKEFTKKVKFLQKNLIKPKMIKKLVTVTMISLKAGSMVMNYEKNIFSSNNFKINYRNTCQFKIQMTSIC